MTRSARARQLVELVHPTVRQSTTTEDRCDVCGVLPHYAKGAQAHALDRPGHTVTVTVTTSVAYSVPVPPEPPVGYYAARETTRGALWRAEQRPAAECSGDPRQLVRTFLNRAAPLVTTMVVGELLPRTRPLVYPTRTAAREAAAAIVGPGRRVAVPAPKEQP